MSNDQIRSGDNAETPTEVEQLEMVMAHIPTKDLYGLQASVMQEVQSRACTDATNLEVGRGFTEMLQITCDQLTMEKEEEKECADMVREGIDNDIQPNPQQRTRRKKKHRGEDQPHCTKIDQYRKEIKELKENLNPMTP
jgi:hypothetical protein